MTNDVALDRLREEAREAGLVFEARFGLRWYFTCNFTTPPSGKANTVEGNGREYSRERKES